MSKRALAAVSLAASLTLVGCAAFVSFDDHETTDETANRSRQDAGALKDAIVTTEDAAPGVGSSFPSFVVGGRVEGAGDARITLAMAGQTVEVGEGAFAFPARVPSGTAYEVRVAATPAGTGCIVSDGAGLVGSADVNAVLVACRPVSAELTTLRVLDYVSREPLRPAFHPSVRAFDLAVLPFQWWGTERTIELEVATVDPSATVTLRRGADPLVRAVGGFRASPVVVRGRNELLLDVASADGVEKRTTLTVTVNAHHYLKAPYPRPGARFGAAVAMRGDTLLVGAPDEPRDFGNSGGAYVFRHHWTIDTWQEELLPNGPDMRRGTRFGKAVAVGDDVVFVAAEEADGGVVLAFRRTSQGWEPAPALRPDAHQAASRFGTSLVYVPVPPGGSGTEQLVVGAPGYTSDPRAPESGAAYVFARSESGTWDEQQRLEPAVPTAGAHFGSALAALVPGDPPAPYHRPSIPPRRLAIGAPGDGEHAGATFLFDAAVRWAPVHSLQAEPALAGDGFGATVAFASRSIDALFVGASGNGTVTQLHQGQTPEQWVRYTMPNLAFPGGGSFGAALASGGTVAIGAPSIGAGRVFPFHFPVTTLEPPVMPPGLGFGSALAQSWRVVVPDGPILYDPGGMIAIGAPGDSSAARGVDGDASDTSMPGAGAVFVQ